MANRSPEHRATLRLEGDERNDRWRAMAPARQLEALKGRRGKKQIHLRLSLADKSFRLRFFRHINWLVASVPKRRS